MWGHSRTVLSRYRIVGFAAILILVVCIAYNQINGITKKDTATCASAPFSSFTGKVTSLPIGGLPFTVAVAQTGEEMSRGLGGVRCLTNSDAMLFIYDSPELSSFWMKDMLMSIDIIWLDTNGSIITIADSVSPQTYPATFRPEAPAKYVLETRAGLAKEKNWDTGTILVSPSELR